MCRLQLLGLLLGFLVAVLRMVDDSLPLVSLLVLAEVSVVVTHHLSEEDNCLGVLGILEQVVFKEVEQVRADILEFFLDFVLVLADQGQEFVLLIVSELELLGTYLEFLLVLNCLDSSPSVSAGLN